MVEIPVDQDIVWTGCYDGILERHDLSTGQSRDVSVWPEAVESVAAEELKYRFQWTFPIALSPHDPTNVYVGSQFVHRTTNGGQTWEVVSPDLTSADPELSVDTFDASDRSPVVLRSLQPPLGTAGIIATAKSGDF